MKLPVIVSVRTNPYQNYRNKSDKYLIPLLYPRATGTVFGKMIGKRRHYPLCSTLLQTV